MRGRAGWGVAFALAMMGLDSGPATGQGVDRVVPGNGLLEPGRLVPFQARYEQMGAQMRVALTRNGGPDGTWDFVMQMPVAGGSGEVVDHVAHRARDLRFAYRRFGFGAFRDEYLEVTADASELEVGRWVREGDPIPRAQLTLEEPVVDGTFLYWLLGLLPLEDGAAFTFPTWGPTPEGAAVRETAALRVVGKAPFQLDGETVDAWTVEAEVPSGTVQVQVIPTPPYLLSQTAVAADGTRTQLLTLVGLSVEPADGDREAIARAGRAFSRAYMAGDTATIRSLYTEDAVLHPPDREVEGVDAIVRYFAPVPGRAVTDHRMEREALDVWPGGATETGHWHQTLRRPDGTASTSSGRYLIEWVRGLDGAWRIRRDIWHRPASPPSGGGGAGVDA